MRVIVIVVSKEATEVARSIILCRKVLPGGTTLVAERDLVFAYVF